MMPLTPVQNQENDLGHKRINQLLHHQKFSNHYTPLHVLTKLEKKIARSNRKKKSKIIHILSIPINTEIVSKC